METTEIFICFNCGTKNRVPRKKQSKAICAKCKSKLLVANDIGNDFASKGKPLDRSQAHGVKSATSLPFRPFIFLIIISGLGYFLLNQDQSSPSTEVSEVQLPPVVSQQPGILWNKTGQRGSSPFRIVTNRDADYYVKLVDYSSNSEKLGIFVKGGQPLEIEVPAGSYKLKYAYGESWRGLNWLFGPDNHTKYQQSMSRLDFTKSSGYTVELIKQAGGNMQTRGISAANF